MTIAHAARRWISPSAFSLARVADRYADWSAAERAVVQREAVPFEGDIPPMAGREHLQRRLVYARPRSFRSLVQDVRYTALGMAWVDGRLERRYSFQEVGLRHLCDWPLSGSQRFDEATILQSDTPRTYGDWMSEHVATLSSALGAGGLTPPLLLPRAWHEKPYVRRDLAALQIESVGIDRTVTIGRATVLAKTRPAHYWTRAEARGVREAMAIVPAPARPGGAVYLSRYGEQGESPARRIDNATIEAAMAANGVRVARTANRTQDEFIALAEDAETVFGDHGSALHNMLYWQTRRVVEFFAPDYWESAFLFLSNALGVGDYHLWRIDSSTTVEALSDRIGDLLRRPIRAAPSD